MTEKSASGRADPANRKLAENNDEVSIDKGGNVRQKGHGNMDETMIPQKPEPEAGPYEPAAGHLDNPKEVEPDSKDDLSA